MIININNKPHLVVEQLKEYGPEPHYKLMVGNKMLEDIYVVHPSGIIGICETKTETIETYGKEREKYGKKITIKSLFYFLMTKRIHHRECGPASFQTMIEPRKEVYFYSWISNGIRHRLDGPAIFDANRYDVFTHEEKEEIEYYVNGVKYESEKKFKRAALEYKQQHHIK